MKIQIMCYYFALGFLIPAQCMERMRDQSTHQPNGSSIDQSHDNALLRLTMLHLQQGEPRVQPENGLRPEQQTVPYDHAAPYEHYTQPEMLPAPEQSTPDLTKTMPLLKHAAMLAAKETKLDEPLQPQTVVNALLNKSATTLQNAQAIWNEKAKLSEEIKATEERLRELKTRESQLNTDAKTTEEKKSKINRAIHEVADTNPDLVSPEVLSRSRSRR